MAKISTIPTEFAIKKAKEKGENVEEFIRKYSYDTGTNDIRATYKNGEFWEDLKITRKNGYAFSIHELPSECVYLQKFRIKEYGENGVRKIFAYSDGLDLEKLQKDQNYLNAIGDWLLSKERIEEKVKVSLEHGNKDYIYIGTLEYDKKTRRYRKAAQQYENAAEKIDFQREEKQKMQKQKQQKKKEEQEKAKKTNLVDTITSGLGNLNIEQLEKLAKMMGF